MGTGRFAIVVLIVALALVVYSIFGGGGYSSYIALRENVQAQQQKNTETERQLTELEGRINGLHGNDSRALEKAARDELGMARPDEMIFVFEDRGK